MTTIHHAELSDILGERALTRPSITAGTGVPVIPFDDGVDNNDLDFGADPLDDDFDPLLAVESAASSTPMTSRPSAEITLPWPTVERADFLTTTALVPVAQKRSHPLIRMNQDDEDSADDQLLDLASDDAHQSTSSTPTLQSVSARSVAVKKSVSLPSGQTRSHPLITKSQDDKDRADDQLLDSAPDGAHQSTSSTPTLPSVYARCVVAKKSASFSPARLHGSNNNTSGAQCSQASSTVTPSKKADRPAPAGKAPGGSSSQSKKGTTVSGKT